MKSFQTLALSALLGTMTLMSLTLLSNQAVALESIFGSNPEPLSVEDAFPAELINASGDQLQLQFTIADGYYLYEKKFSYESDEADIDIGAPVYPKPLIHEDEFFGKSQVFRDATNITLPINNTNKVQSFNLTVGFQGCADMGLCYPPTTQLFKINLPAQKAVVADKSVIAPLTLPAATSESTAASTSLGQLAQADTNKLDIKDILKNKLTFNTDADSQPLLHPSEAFVPSITKAQNGQIDVQWIIQPGYYLYRDKIKAELSNAGNAMVSSIDVDRGEMQHDEFFGDVEVIREIPTARIALNNTENLQTADLEVFYQGCADIGVCFPPESKTLPVLFINSANSVAAANDNANGSNNTNNSNNTVSSSAATAALSTNANEDSATIAASQTVLPVSEQDKLTGLLEAGNLGLIALAFYVAGLLLAFTACVYPMIPILTSLIAGQGEKISTTKAFSLSLVYVLSMASVFAVIGILVGLSGFNIQPLFQNPWVLSAFAALFVVLALSMFGLFQLQMPSALQAKVNDLSNKQTGGTYTGVAVMGVLSALIVGPCVTPPLVAALAYIANTGDAVIGGIALFAIGIGMGTPLLLIGTSLGKFMPKAGGWMDTTQRIFGVILIAVAIYMLSRFLPGNIIMLMYAALAILSGVFFGATDQLDSDSRGVQRFGKGMGLIAVIYGVVLMVGALAGNKSMLSPLKGVVGQSSSVTGQANTNNEHVTFQRFKSSQDLDAILADAKAQNRAVLLDFYADWCVSCKEMEAFTFPDAAVKEQLKDVLLIQADVTKNDADDKALLKRFNLFGPPAIMLYDTNGIELTAGRVVGFMKAKKFSEHLQAYLNQGI